MERISKNRKGVVWKYLTGKERDALMGGVAKGTLLVLMGDEWQRLDLKIGQFFCADRAYWIAEWDKDADSDYPDEREIVCE